MKNFIQQIKKVVLFLFGVILIIWGYKANANNNEKPKTDDSKPKEVEKKDTIPTPAPTQPAEESEPIDVPKEAPKETNATPKTPEKKATPQPKPEAKQEEPKKEEKKIEEAPKTVIETSTTEESSGTE